MGSCKDEMKPKSDEAKGAFGRFKDKVKGKGAEPPTQSFADMVYDAHVKLAQLIAIKQNELTAEKGREEYNRKALGLLKTMNFHLEEVMTAGAEYSNS